MQSPFLIMFSQSVTVFHNVPPVHVLRHTEKQNMHSFSFFAARMQWMQAYRADLHTPGRVTQILAKHVSMFLSVLERICHEDTEPQPFTVSLTDVQGPYMLPCTLLLASCTSSNPPDPRFNKLFKNIRGKKSCTTYLVSQRLLI